MVNGNIENYIAFMFCMVSLIIIIFSHLHQADNVKEIRFNVFLEILIHAVYDCVPLLIFSVGILFNIFAKAKYETKILLNYICGFFGTVYLVTNIIHNTVEFLEDIFGHSTCHVHHKDKYFLIFGTIIYLSISFICFIMLKLVNCIEKNKQSVNFNGKACLLNYLYSAAVILPDFLPL
ncbi:hypothetical protein MXB_3282, partial [Myxobolus squamalis]